jgi:CubicO group peptidase (beta-lactamase class C family)
MPTHRLTQRYFTVIGTMLFVCTLFASASRAASSEPISIKRFVVANPSLPTVEIPLRKKVSGVIRGAEVHRYTFAVNAGQFFAVRLEQTGGDLSFVLFDPDQKLVEIIDQNSGGEVEVATGVAEKTGVYSVQVAVFDYQRESTAYAIEIALREALGKTPQSRAEQLFTAWYDREHPGAAVAVLKAGKPIYRNARGLASVEHSVSITSKTKFELASVSKQFTGFAVALLIERGMLQLDDDIRKYLPEMHDFSKPIKLSHLLSHTSGLRDWDAAFGLAGMKIEDGISTQRILQFAVDQRSLNFDPGEEEQYSNTGYTLLGEIVARATGQPFAAWLKQNVFDPIGMHDTSLNADYGAIVKNKASSYKGRAPSSRLLSGNSSVAGGSSSVISTIDDLVKWTKHFETKTIGGDALANRLQQVGQLNSGKATTYAYGNWYSLSGDAPRASHLGLAAGFRTVLSRSLNNGVTVIYLSNDGDDATFERAARIGRVFRGVAEKRTPAPDGEPSPKTQSPHSRDYTPYLGTYYSDELRTSYTLESRQGTLVAIHRINGVVPLIAEQEDNFSSAQWYMPEIRFVRGSENRPAEMIVSTQGARNMHFRRINGR